MLSGPRFVKLALQFVGAARTSCTVRNTPTPLVGGIILGGE